MTKKELQVTNITKIPSGTAMAAECEGITLINTHAPLGKAKQMEREKYFNTDLAYLLRDALEKVLL